MGAISTPYGCGILIVKDNVSGQTKEVAITIRDLITDNGFEDGVTSITIKEGQVAFIKKKVPNTQWGWDYAQWNFNNSIISIRKVRNGGGVPLGATPQYTLALAE